MNKKIKVKKRDLIDTRKVKEFVPMCFFTGK
jgi:hypothetical protein